MYSFKITPVFVIACLVFGWGGCGYRLEGNNPPLPAGAKTIALAPIQNQTFQTGLEIRLTQHLKQLLRNNASVQMSSSQKADLLLEIRLEDFTTQQTAFSSDGSITELHLDLAGTVALNDLREQQVLWQESGLNMKETLSYEQDATSKGLAEPPMQRGLDKITNAFARMIYARLFFLF